MDEFLSLEGLFLAIVKGRDLEIKKSDGKWESTIFCRSMPADAIKECYERDYYRIKKEKKKMYLFAVKLKSGRWIQPAHYWRDTNKALEEYDNADDVIRLDNTMIEVDE